MPTSNWQNISYNIDLVKRLNPQSILDIGVGFGHWGILFREFLEVWGDENISGNWKRTVDGVEIFPSYLKSYHKYFYNNIYIGDALAFMRKINRKYDLINCGDVIEHFEKQDALQLIDLCLENAGYVLVNIPIGKNWKQGAAYGNENERHISFWSNNDFMNYENVIIKKFKDIELRDFSVILLSKNKIDLTSAYGKHFKVKSILKNKLGLGKIIERPVYRKK